MYAMPGVVTTAVHYHSPLPLGSKLHKQRSLHCIWTSPLKNTEGTEMLDFLKHWIFALLAAEMNFWACLFSGAGQGPDAQVWKSGLYTTPEGREGQTAHWCSLCFSSGPWQMKLCLGKFSAALTLPSVLTRWRSRKKKKRPSKRKKKEKMSTSSSCFQVVCSMATGGRLTGHLVFAFMLQSRRRQPRPRHIEIETKTLYIKEQQQQNWTNEQNLWFSNSSENHQACLFKQSWWEEGFYMKQAGGVTGVDIISVSVTGVGPRTQQLDEVLPPRPPNPTPWISGSAPAAGSTRTSSRNTQWWDEIYMNCDNIPMRVISI